jgi:hypothetical protein
LLAVSVVSVISGFFLWKRRESSDELSDDDDVSFEREEEQPGKDEEVHWKFHPNYSNEMDN